jgi:sec-independent protein translocase protein TatC
MSAAAVTLMDHLRELRRRLIASVVVVGVGAAIGYVFRAAIIAFLQRPLHEPLYYTSPTGSFEFVMQVCLLVGFLIALPVVLYNGLRFIEPALPRRFSRAALAAIIGISFGLAIGGAAFGYYVSLPAAFRFFTTVGTNRLHPLISIDQYFGFVVAYLGMFALIFQLPLIILLIDRIKPMGPRRMRKWRKFVVVGAFAVAIVTPSAPDPLSQVILALPIIILYEATLICLWVREHSRQRSQPQLASPPPVASPPHRLAASPPRRQTREVSDLRHVQEPASVAVGGHILDLRKTTG